MFRAKAEPKIDGIRSPAAREALTAAVLKAAGLLKISQSELSQILGISAASVSRMAGGRYFLDPDSKEWQLAALFIRMFRSLDSITGGNDELSRKWLRSENRALLGTPANLLIDIASLVRVVQYLDASRAQV